MRLEVLGKLIKIIYLIKSIEPKTFHIYNKDKKKKMRELQVDERDTAKAKLYTVT
jgi:hypothetical protein